MGLLGVLRTGARAVRRAGLVGSPEEVMLQQKCEVCDTPGGAGGVHGETASPVPGGPARAGAGVQLWGARLACVDSGGT